MSSNQNNPNYSYKAPWTIYSLCTDPLQPHRVAISSFILSPKNKIQILEKNNHQLNVMAEHELDFPATKIMWSPKSSSNETSLLATSNDYIRIFKYQNQTLELKSTFLQKPSNQVQKSVPITSFDWNEVDSNLLGCSSLDMTCSIWDISNSKLLTHMIAHDREVYDLAFGEGVHIFGSVGGEGSLRIFDLRNLEHSTILFETPDSSPLLKLAWNKRDPNYIATLKQDSNQLIILDIRYASLPVSEIINTSYINTFQWMPQSSLHLSTGDDHGRVCLWDLSQMKKMNDIPVMINNLPQPIHQVSPSKVNPEILTVAAGDSVQLFSI